MAQDEVRESDRGTRALQAVLRNLDFIRKAITGFFHVVKHMICFAIKKKSLKLLYGQRINRE